MAYDAFSQKMAIIAVLDFPNTSSDIYIIGLSGSVRWPIVQISVITLTTDSWLTQLYPNTRTLL